LSVWVSGLGVPYNLIKQKNLKRINGKCLTKQRAEKKHQRNVQTLSGTFMAISRQIHGTSWHFPHVIFTSLSCHFSWHFDGTLKNMAPNTFMPFSRRFHGTCPQNFKIIIIQYVMFMSLSCHFHGIFFNLKDKPYSCQIHVTLMALSLKLLDCHDSVYHIHVRSMSLSQSGESAMKLG